MGAASSFNLDEHYRCIPTATVSDPVGRADCFTLATAAAAAATTTTAIASPITELRQRKARAARRLPYSHLTVSTPSNCDDGGELHSTPPSNQSISEAPSLQCCPYESDPVYTITGGAVVIAATPLQGGDVEPLDVDFFSPVVHRLRVVDRCGHAYPPLQSHRRQTRLASVALLVRLRRTSHPTSRRPTPDATLLLEDVGSKSGWLGGCPSIREKSSKNIVSVAFPLLYVALVE